MMEALENLGRGALFKPQRELMMQRHGQESSSLLYNTLRSELKIMASPFSKDAHVWKALRNFLDKAWFQRSWTLQEVCRRFHPI